MPSLIGLPVQAVDALATAPEVALPVCHGADAVLSVIAAPRRRLVLLVG